MEIPKQDSFYHFDYRSSIHCSDILSDYLGLSSESLPFAKPHVQLYILAHYILNKIIKSESHRKSTAVCRK